MTEIEKRAKLLAAWRKPGGSTPKEKSPPLYKTLVELLDAIADLRARNDALVEKFAYIAKNWPDSFAARTARAAIAANKEK